MDLNSYFICFLPSIALMVLFVFINLSYYQIMYGKNIKAFLIRTIFLNTLAILIGWFPVVYFWADFSIRYLLPGSCIFGAIGCVGSRFIYSEVVPAQLAEQVAKLIREKVEKESKEKEK